MKILNSKQSNFNKDLDNLLLRRKTKVHMNSVSVIKIINDVKKNGDKALLKYEKRFNRNRVIKPSSDHIARSIKSLNPKVKKAIDVAYSRIYKFHSLQKFKNISYTDKLQNKLVFTNRVSRNLCAWFISILSFKCFNECSPSNSRWCKKNYYD